MNAPLPSAQPSFLHSDRRLARRVARPIQRFLHIEAAGGILLVVATIIALVWANSPLHESYATFWHTNVEVRVGGYEFGESLAHVVNDLLMAFFFFVAGLEIKRELVVGELRDPRRVAVPAIAALGGMAIPALLFVAINAGGEGRHGWGIPMATDIAFAVGVVALLGHRVPSGGKTLLLTLAIVDDIGAIAVIAIFYSAGVEPLPLLVAGGVIVTTLLLHRFDVTYGPVFVGLACVLWLAVYESGVHATIAGVAMGLLTPARPRQTMLEANEIVDVLERREDLSVAEVRATATAIGGTVSACDRMIDALHPWTAYVIVPLFALANAGIEISADTFASPSAVFGGVVVGLVVGKFVGVSLFAWLAVKAGLGRLPVGVTWAHMRGLAAVAGIGFTVSLLVAGLAFSDETHRRDAMTGTFTASVIAALAGVVLLSAAGRSRRTAAKTTDDVDTT